MLLVNRILDIFVYKIGFINPVWISSFRIYGSLIFLFHFLSILPDFQTFWGQNAIVNPDIMDANIDNLMPTIYDIHQLINKYAALGFQTVANTVAIIYIISLISLALGLMSKISAAIALLTHLVLMQSINIFIYGVDYMTTISLFYLLIFPVGNYHSLDNYLLKKSNSDNFEQGIYLRIFQIHWCLAYFFSGLSKALGPTWWNGEAIWKALNSYNQASLFNPELWVHYPYIITFLGILTVLLELLFPIGVSVKILRKPWIVSIIFMHIAIGASVGLYFFSIVLFLIILLRF